MSISSNIISRFEGGAVVFLLLDSLDFSFDLSDVLREFNYNNIHVIINVIEYIPNHNLMYNGRNHEEVKSGYEQAYKVYINYCYMKDYEIKKGIIFTRVIKSRPDVGFYNSDSHYKISNGIRVGVRNFWPINDQVADMGREDADVYFRYYEIYFYKTREIPYNTGVNDFAVYEYLRGKNVRVTVWDMEFVIVRENGPRCGSVSKVRNVVCQVVGGFEVFGREGEKMKLAIVGSIQVFQANVASLRRSNTFL